jgi:hypothetical protein
LAFPLGLARVLQAKVMSVIRSSREPPTLSVPALKSGRMLHAIECMSSWVGSWLSCCHRGIQPGLGVLSGYDRMFHWLGAGWVACVCGGSELVMSGSVGWLRAEEGGVESRLVAFESVVGLGGGVFGII